MFEAYNLIFSSGNPRGIPGDMLGGGCCVSPRMNPCSHSLRACAPSLACTLHRLLLCRRGQTLTPARAAFLPTQPQVRSPSVVNLCWEPSEQISNVHRDIKNNCSTDLSNNVQQPFIIFGIFFCPSYCEHCA